MLIDKRDKKTQQGASKAVKSSEAVKERHRKTEKKRNGKNKGKE